MSFCSRGGDKWGSLESSHSHLVSPINRLLLLRENAHVTVCDSLLHAQLGACRVTGEAIDKAIWLLVQNSNSKYGHQCGMTP